MHRVSPDNLTFVAPCLYSNGRQLVIQHLDPDQLVQGLTIKLLFRDPVQYIKEHYHDEQLVRNFFSVGDYSHEDRTVAEDNFIASILSIQRSVNNKYDLAQWCQKIAADRFRVCIMVTLFGQ